MTHQEATDLIREAVLGPGPGARAGGGSWADLGAGAGTFTFALAELLGQSGRVLAVDRDRRAVERLRRAVRAEAGREPARRATVVAGHGDLRRPETVPGLRGTTLDGVLFANALHFDPAPGRVLGRYRGLLGSGGRVVVVEYDDRPASPWVPHPLPVYRLRDAAVVAGLGPPEVLGERPSAYGGRIYCARLTVADGTDPDAPARTRRWRGPR